MVERWTTDRPPEVNDLIALCEELWGIFNGKVAEDAGLGRVSRLIDVHALNGLALLRSIIDLTRAATTNGYG